MSTPVSSLSTPRASAWTDTAVLAGRGLLLMTRSPATVAMTAMFPVILLVFLSVSFAKVVMPEGSYGDYVNYSVPLFAAMGITFATLSTANAAHADRVAGFDDRLRTLPMSPVAPLAGRIIADMVRNLATVAVVTIVGVALGFRFDNGTLGAVGYFAVPLIYGFGLAWLMVAVAMHAKSAEAANATLNALLVVLSFLSTGFVRLDDLPGWAQPIARVNPISHVVDAMRAFAHGGTAGDNLWALGAWTVGLTALCGWLAVRRYARRD